jgi:hypothetical protein
MRLVHASLDGKIPAASCHPYLFPPPECVSEKYEGFRFRAKGPMARQPAKPGSSRMFGLDEGASPKWGCDRGATKPEGLLRENPAGGGCFVRSLRWLGTQSPLREFSRLSASPAPKTSRRGTPRIFRLALTICGRLNVIQFRVVAAFGFELVMRTEFYEARALEHDDQVGHANGGKPMRN